MRRAPAATLAVWITTALVLPAARSWPGDPPKLKEGLWDVHGESVDTPGDKHTEFAYKLCRDHAFDKATDAAAKNAKGCRTLIKNAGDGRFESASACAADGFKIISKGVTVYKGDTSVHAESSATYTPGFRGRTAQSLTEDQQYLGKCPAGMKPGDRIAPDGILLHHAP